MNKTMKPLRRYRRTEKQTLSETKTNNKSRTGSSLLSGTACEERFEIFTTRRF
ncbi:MAG: hypothetical protein IJ338_10755 [Bacteroidaceae bacterium]|nr:hypothetical protein [Bacteroidaceae bacterium]